MLGALWTWSASLHRPERLKREPEGQPESQARERPLFHNHKNHKAFESLVVDQVDDVKYGITTGLYRENKGGKD